MDNRFYDFFIDYLRHKIINFQKCSNIYTALKKLNWKFLHCGAVNVNEVWKLADLHLLKLTMYFKDSIKPKLDL